MSYRLGASYTQDYLKINNTDINQSGVNAGFSVPLSRLNNIDLLFAGYSTRGKSSNGLIKDDVLKFALSVNIGELWFYKTKRRQIRFFLINNL